MMTTLIRRFRASLAGAAALAVAMTASSSARADFGTIITEGHVDVFAVGRTAAGLSMFSLAEDEDTGDEIDLDPADTLFIVGPNTLTPRPASSNFDFIGVGAGQDFYKLSSEPIEDQIYAGASAEDIRPTSSILRYTETDPRLSSNPTARWVKINLVSVSGPGAFSMWQGNTPDAVWMASSNGINSSDAIFIPAGAHIHYNWGFSAEGQYAVTVKATAFDGTTGLAISSADTTYNFYAGTRGAGVVPEPASLAMLAIGGAGMGWASRRRKKSLAV